MDFPYPFYFYGSSDSKDQDVIIWIPETLMPATQQERKLLVQDLMITHQKTWNATLVTIKDGYLTDTIYPKAWIDGLNNSLYNTYGLHTQTHPNPIKGLVKRNKLLAIYKAARTILTLLTRTHLRTSIRPVVNGVHPFELKLNALKVVNFLEIEDFNQKNTQNEDIWKTIAFYLGQNISLVENNIEIYTKKDLVRHHPNLENLVYRKAITAQEKQILQEYLQKWLTMAEHYGIYISEGILLKCNDEMINMKDEVF